MSKQTPDDDFPWCTAKGTPGNLYKLKVDDLSPTQFAVGAAEVAVRAARILKKYEKDPQRLLDYLHVRPVPIVIWKERFHLVDHHHLVRALHDALHGTLGGELSVYVAVLANMSGISHHYFWKQMHAQNNVYLFDREGGGPRSPNELPAHITDLGYDPYRSLAWIVRSRHGYLKNEAPFSEFKWANFFRMRILLEPHILAAGQDIDGYMYSKTDDGKPVLTEEGEEVVDEAMFLATSPEARGLPGYRGP